MDVSKVIDKKIDYWKKKFIDLSKRNNLVRYRSSKSNIDLEFDSYGSLNNYSAVSVIKRKIMQVLDIESPIEKITIVKDDPKYNIFIETAVAGNVDYIISQDNHLLKLKEFREIKIITP